MAVYTGASVVAIVCYLSLVTVEVASTGVADPKCVRGTWSPDECVCSSGYRTDHKVQDKQGALGPVYCNSTGSIVVQNYQWTGTDVLQLIATVLSVLLATTSALSFLHLIVHLITLFFVNKKFRVVKLKETELMDNIAENSRSLDLIPTLWIPTHHVYAPDMYSLINTVEDGNDEEVSQEVPANAPHTPQLVTVSIEPPQKLPETINLIDFEPDDDNQSDISLYSSTNNESMVEDSDVEQASLIPVSPPRVPKKHKERKKDRASKEASPKTLSRKQDDSGKTAKPLKKKRRAKEDKGSGNDLPTVQKKKKKKVKP